MGGGVRPLVRKLGLKVPLADEPGLVSGQNPAFQPPEKSKSPSHSSHLPEISLVLLSVRKGLSIAYV